MSIAAGSAQRYHLIDENSAQHKQALRNLIRDMQRDEANSYPFLEPVNWEGKHDISRRNSPSLFSPWSPGLPTSHQEAHGYLNCEGMVVDTYSHALEKHR